MASPSVLPGGCVLPCGRVFQRSEPAGIIRSLADPLRGVPGVPPGSGSMLPGGLLEGLPRGGIQGVFSRFYPRFSCPWGWFRNRGKWPRRGRIWPVEKVPFSYIVQGVAARLTTFVLALVLWLWFSPVECVL